MFICCFCCFFKWNKASINFYFLLIFTGFLLDFFSLFLFNMVFFQLICVCRLKKLFFFLNNCFFLNFHYNLSLEHFKLNLFLQMVFFINLQWKKLHILQEKQKKKQSFIIEEKEEPEKEKVELMAFQ